MIRYVKERGVDGVICGHIHAAAIREVEGLTYVNCGDWVDSCTAILEHHDGRMELIEWGARLPRDEPALLRHGAAGPNAGVSQPAPTPAVARETE